MLYYVIYVIYAQQLVYSLKMMDPFNLYREQIVTLFSKVLKYGVFCYKVSGIFRDSLTRRAGNYLNG